MSDEPRTDATHDPGDAVPSGVAVQEPAPLSEEDLAVKRRLEECLHPTGGSPTEPGQPKGRGETAGPEKRGA